MRDCGSAPLRDFPAFAWENLRVLLSEPSRNRRLLVFEACGVVELHLKLPCAERVDTCPSFAFAGPAIQRGGQQSGRMKGWRKPTPGAEPRPQSALSPGTGSPALPPPPCPRVSATGGPWPTGTSEGTQLPASQPFPAPNISKQNWKSQKRTA